MRFVFDECLSDKIPKALQIMGKDTCSYKDHWESGAPDTQWIPQAARNGWCIVTSDKLRPHRRLALSQPGSRVFLIASRNLKPWEEFRLLVDKWDDIEKAAEDTAAPFILRVPKKGRLEQIRL
jgi:predicted nuclease of predicted toxin-antitoxin system